MSAIKSDSTTPDVNLVSGDLILHQWAKEPIKVRLSIDATKGTPSLAAMIGKVLQDAGATITASDQVMSTPTEFKPNLRGLQVHIGQLTWVRDEEAQRWGTQP